MDFVVLILQALKDGAQAVNGFIQIKKMFNKIFGVVKKRSSLPPVFIGYGLKTGQSFYSGPFLFWHNDV